MTLFKRFLDFYINSSLHVALAVLSFSVLTAYELNLVGSIFFYSATFCASVAGYNFVKYFGLTKFYYRSLTTKLKYIQLVSVLSLMGFGFVIFQLQQSSQIVYVFLALITFLYAIPMGIKTPKNLRSVGGVKIYIIAFVWAMTTVVLPILESQLVLNLDHWILVLQRIFIVIVLMLPFEIRDLDVDQVHLSTVPQKIGIQNSRLHMIEPLSYLEFNYLVENAKAVITDSGGITEETTVMGIPCMTLRNNTERPETVKTGTNELLGTDPKAIKPAMEILFAGKWKKGSIPELWDGKTADRIISDLARRFG